MVTNGRHGARRSAFVEIPLRLRDPVPLALLAVILTATPGTAWLEHDRERDTLLLHVFDMIEEEEWRVLIRDRYETLLLEAFA
jgi:multicomponent K+:H+ antiporter subunit E